MSTSPADLLPRVEQLYMAYYGRPADAAGAAYWATRLAAMGGDVNSVVGAFAQSPESMHLYGGMTDSARINTMYQQVFGRDADTGGLNFYMGMLQSGQMTQDHIMLNILDGARGQDLTQLQTHVNDALAMMNSANMNALMAQYGASMNLTGTTIQPGSGMMTGATTAFHDIGGTPGVLDLVGVMPHDAGMMS